MCEQFDIDDFSSSWNFFSLRKPNFLAMGYSEITCAMVINLNKLNKLDVIPMFSPCSRFMKYRQKLLGVGIFDKREGIFVFYSQNPLQMGKGRHVNHRSQQPIRVQ